MREVAILALHTSTAIGLQGYMAKQSRKNTSRLFVPEPPFRPGDTPDYSHISVPVAHSPSRPDPLCEAHETTEHATRLIRVLRFSGEVSGDWVPEISAESLRGALHDIALTRAMDERMFNMQRQGKMSFYMKSTGEEAVSVGHALALRDSDMIFPTYRQQGILIHHFWKPWHTAYTGCWLGHGECL